MYNRIMSALRSQVGKKCFGSHNTGRRIKQYGGVFKEIGLVAVLFSFLFLSYVRQYCYTEFELHSV